jgi:hypothetical protein
VKRFFLSLSSVVGVKGVLSSSSSSSSQQLCVCERVDSSLCGLSTTLSLSLSRRVRVVVVCSGEKKKIMEDTKNEKKNDFPPRREEEGNLSLER